MILHGEYVLDKAIKTWIPDRAVFVGGDLGAYCACVLERAVW